MIMIISCSKIAVGHLRTFFIVFGNFELAKILIILVEIIFGMITSWRTTMSMSSPES